MAKLNIKKGDKVVVLTGTDKGQKGKVIQALPQKDKVLVEGVHQVKRHQKPSQQHPTGGIIQKEGPHSRLQRPAGLPEMRESHRGQAGAAGKRQVDAPVPGMQREIRVRRHPMARLRTFYQEKIVGQMVQEFGYKNLLAVPRLEKVVVNMGLGEAIANPKVMDSAVDELRAITGQQPVVTKARKSIAQFKLREGMKIGAKVTLRGPRMFEFLDRLMNVALPRVRDFKGVSKKAFDGRGNYSLGIREEIIFPEIDYDKLERIKGLNITIVTTAKTDEECRSLLGYFGMPFKK